MKHIIKGIKYVLVGMLSLIILIIIVCLIVVVIKYLATHFQVYLGIIAIIICFYYMGKAITEEFNEKFKPKQ